MKTQAEAVKKVYQPEATDLRSITRSPNRMICTVQIHLGYNDGPGEDGREKRLIWLRAGECQIRTDQKPSGTCRLEAHLADNACDFEHDTAWAFKLPLIGLRLGDMAVHYSKTYFDAWVDPDAGGRRPDFHVPRPGYNPMKHKDAGICRGIYNEKKGLYCKWNDKKQHVIVPEGFYVPPFDPELYRAVAGKRVEIVIGPTDEEGEEDEGDEG